MGSGRLTAHAEIMIWLLAAALLIDSFSQLAISQLATIRPELRNPTSFWLDERSALKSSFDGESSDLPIACHRIVTTGGTSGNDQRAKRTLERSIQPPRNIAAITSSGSEIPRTAGQ